MSVLVIPTALDRPYLAQSDPKIYRRRSKGVYIPPDLSSALRPDWSGARSGWRPRTDRPQDWQWQTATWAAMDEEAVRGMVEPKHPSLSLSRQCALLGLARSRRRCHRLTRPAAGRMMTLP